MTIQFTKGNYITLRAAKKVHLGVIELDVYEGDEFEYDGQTLKLGGKEYNVPNLRAGIRAGWFVAEGAYTAEETPSVTPVVAPTVSDKLRRPVQAVEDDERQVGFATRGARDRAAGVPKSAAASDEGVPVGKVRIASHQRTVLTDSSAVSQEINRLDNLTAKVTSTPIATGDVQEAAAGESLEDILPNVPSTGRPTPGRAGDGQDGMTAEERADAARRARLASVASAPAAPPVDASEVAAVTAAAESDEADVAGLFGDLLADPDADADTADLNAAKARMALAKLAVPGFAWDLASPWRMRVKLGLAKREDPVYLNAIMAIETDTVKKHIAEGLKS
jgi:hypothetical protein